MALSFWNVAVWCKIIIFRTAAQAPDQARWDTHLPLWIAAAAAALLYDDWSRICFTQWMAVAAAAAVVAAVGVPGETRNDEAITGAAGAPVVTVMVEDSQPMPALTQSGAAAYRRLHAPNEGIDAHEARIIATATKCICADNAID